MSRVAVSRVAVSHVVVSHVACRVAAYEIFPILNTRMGGRIHGFLGGALLTSAWVYYTGEYIKKDLQFVSRQLRISDTIINDGIISGKDLNKDISTITPRSTKEVKAGVIETSKDIWNEEIIKGVNWLYSINWYQLWVNTDKTIDDITDKLAHKVADASKK